MILIDVIMPEFKEYSDSAHIQHFEKRGLLYSFYEIGVCISMGEGLLLSVNAMIVYKNIYK